MKTIRGRQKVIGKWITINFGNDNELAVIAGLAEETGELCRASVKRSQGIRGTREEWEEEIKKEVGDVFIKLVDVAEFYGFDLEEAIEERWQTIKKRDWVNNKKGHGLPD